MNLQGARSTETSSSKGKMAISALVSPEERIPRTNRLLITGLLVRFQCGACLRINDLGNVTEDPVNERSASSRPLFERQSPMFRSTQIQFAGSRRFPIFSGGSAKPT